MKNAPIARLGDVFEFQNGRGFKKSEWRESGLPIIRIQNLNDSSAPFNHYDGEYDPKIEVNSGDLLFSWSGTVGSSFGPHLWQRQKGVLNQHIFRVLFLEDLDKRYALHALQFITAEIEKQVSGAVGLVHITKGKLKEFTIPLPPLQEQKRIVAILDEAFEGIDKAIANTEKNLANAKELFESHLNAVFSKKGEGWVTQALGEIADLVDSLHKTPTYIDEGGYPMVRVTDVKGGTLDLTNARRVDEETYHEFSKRHKSSIGDLVLSRVGSYGVPVVVETDEPFCLGQNTVFILPKINPHLLYYYLISPHAKSQIDGFVAGTTQPTISLKSIKSIAVPYPPQDDQETIVANLKSSSLQLETLLKVGRQKSSCLAELKQSILQKAFNGELTSHPDKELAKAGA